MAYQCSGQGPVDTRNRGDQTVREGTNWNRDPPLSEQGERTGGKRMLIGGVQGSLMGPRRWIPLGLRVEL